MKHTRHTVTFQSDVEQTVINLGRIGIGNQEICRITGLSDSQVTYRLHKAKVFSGREHGYRFDWRHGNDPLFSRILDDYSSIMRQDIERNLVPKIVHPEIKVARPKH